MLEQESLSDMFAERLIIWRSVNGRGMGGITRQSIAQLADGVPPPVAAYAVYMAKGRGAPNGGIMRCAPVAIARRLCPARLVQDTAGTCAVTHYAPASQWSCVIVNAVIAVLLSGNAPDLARLLAAAKADGCPDLLSIGRASRIPTSLLSGAIAGKPTPDNMDWMRGNSGSRRHTVLTMQAGLWAATAPLGFEEALVALVNAGGDTDTNAAFAGAVLGARYGATEIPLRWMGYIPQKERLVDLADRLVSL